jgi:hypothetical protein
MTETKSQSNKLTPILLTIIAVLLGALVFAQFSNSTFLNKLFGQKVVTIPNGTRLNVTLQNSVSSATSRRGDLITGTISNPIVIGEDIAISTGSQASGEVISVAPAERFKAGKGGYLTVKFTSIQTPDGKKYPISSTAYSLTGETGGTRLAKGVGKAAIGAGAGALLGTAVGAIAGGRPGRGAWSGAAIGGGVGATSAIISKGKDVGLYSGSQILVTLEHPVQVVALKK